jgi:hypothetical protein
LLVRCPLWWLQLLILICTIQIEIERPCH